MDSYQNIIQGELNAEGLKIAIIVSRWNSTITEALLKGAAESFFQMGGLKDQLTIIKVPGSFEIPLALEATAKLKKYHGLVALGAVIRGETSHYDLIAGQAAVGISQVMNQYQIPISFGVLTTENIEQAMNRSGLKSGNKGIEAMHTTIEMIHLLRKISE